MVRYPQAETPTSLCNAEPAFSSMPYYLAPLLAILVENYLVNANTHTPKATPN
jgi:hypothetical protein